MGQKRMTGGFRIDNIDGKNLHIDPGPGALIRTYQFGFKPKEIDAIIVSHNHTDHYNDAEVLIETMTRGVTEKNGHIIASETVLHGKNGIGPGISQYHQSKSEIHTLKPNTTYKIDNITIKGTETRHSDPTGVGFQIEINGIKISYTSDTEYFEELAEYHKDADILIASVLRERRDEAMKYHMNANEFEKLVSQISPKLAIMTHLGMRMINSDPITIAKSIYHNTGVFIIAARDGLHINLDEFFKKPIENQKKEFYKLLPKKDIP